MILEILANMYVFTRNIIKYMDKYIVLISCVICQNSVTYMFTIAGLLILRRKRKKTKFVKKGEAYSTNNSSIMHTTATRSADTAKAEGKMKSEQKGRITFTNNNTIIYPVC